MLRLIPKRLEIHKITSKNVSGKLKISSTYPKLSDAGSHVGASCLVLCGYGAFCLRPVFGTSRVPPWIDYGLPCGTLGPICWLARRFQEQVCSEIPRCQSNKWHPPHLQANNQRFKNTLLLINPNKSFATFPFFSFYDTAPLLCSWKLHKRARNISFSFCGIMPK